MIALWQPCNRWDVLANLAYAQALAGDRKTAQETWQRIPEANRRLRGQPITRLWQRWAI